MAASVKAALRLPGGSYSALFRHQAAMQWHPHTTVATVVEREGRFLMVEERIEGRLVYNQPAGHLEPGESLAEAALRETLEETAWEVELEALVGVYQNTVPSGICFIRSCYSARPLRQLPDRALDSGIVRALWMSREELQARREQLRSPMVLAVIDDYLAGQRFPLKAITLVGDAEQS